jgi:hypothetical protein
LALKFDSGLGDCAKQIRIDVVTLADFSPAGIRRKDAPCHKEEEGRSESGFRAEKFGCKTT